jgi:hypothetical protein
VKVRRAKIETQSVAIICPYCYEVQPEPASGSMDWTPDDVNRNQGGLVCVGCRLEMALVYKGKVDALLTPGAKP